MLAFGSVQRSIEENQMCAGAVGGKVETPERWMRCALLILLSKLEPCLGRCLSSRYEVDLSIVRPKLVLKALVADKQVGVILSASS